MYRDVYKYRQVHFPRPTSTSCSSSLISTQLHIPTPTRPKSNIESSQASTQGYKTNTYTPQDFILYHKTQHQNHNQHVFPIKQLRHLDLLRDLHHLLRQAVHPRRAAQDKALLQAEGQGRRQGHRHVAVPVRRRNGEAELRLGRDATAFEDLKLDIHISIALFVE